MHDKLSAFDDVGPSVSHETDIVGLLYVLGRAVVGGREPGVGIHRLWISVPGAQI